MHGLDEPDEIAYWRERAQAAEKRLAELRKSLRDKTWLTQSDARFVLQLLDRLTQHDLANTPSQEAYDAVATALANAQAREAALMPVVEAAQAWRRERVPLDDVGKRLAAAVDYLAHEIAAHDGGE